MNFTIRVLLLLAMFGLPSFAEEEKNTEKASETSADTAPEKASEKQDDKGTDKASEKKEDKKENAKDDKKGDKKAAKKAPTKPLPEIALGSKNAPVVMIVYSSLSCGHCAHFTTDVLPEVEKKYIKEGKLRIIFRDYPGDQISLRAHQLAWCKGEIKYLDFTKELYATQEKWLLASDPVAALKTIALKSGMSPQQFDSCLKNQELLDQIIAERLEGKNQYNISATPTIVINAKIYQKALTLKEIDEIMKPYLATTAENKKE